MMDDPLETFGELAARASDETIIAGRYPFQSEEAVLRDVDRKLSLSASDSCLDVGCGPGNLLIPISFLVDDCMGVDHPEVLKRLRQRAPEEDIVTKPGDFRSIDFNRNFDKIIAYSVLHYLEDENEVLAFVDKAMSLLRPGGRLLLGDIPNETKLNRFTSTPFGSEFTDEWEERVAEMNGETTFSDLFDGDVPRVTLDDKMIFRILDHGRGGEFETYLMPQPEGLPFHYTRDDILVHRRT